MSKEKEKTKTNTELPGQKQIRIDYIRTAEARSTSKNISSYNSTSRVCFNILRPSSMISLFLCLVNKYFQNLLCIQNSISPTL